MGSTATAPGQIALPALGDAGAQDLSAAAERRLGDRIMRSILSDPAVLDDPQIQEYVERVWQDLLHAGRQRGEITPELSQTHAWRAFLVKDRSVNAFALPGGYIGVHLGLLAMTRSPDEFASVMAHELSHVTQRHIARMLAQQARTSWVGIASLLLGVLAAGSNPAAAQAMIYGGQAVALQGQLNFSRDMEREADRIGFNLMNEAGYQPAGMALMFEQLQQASRLNDDGRYPYLRTHPLTTERIGEARARLGTAGWEGLGQRIDQGSALAAWHRLAAARARVLMDTRSEETDRLVQASSPASAPPLERLGAGLTRALAWERAGQGRQALSELAQARTLLPALPAAQQPVVARALDLTEIELLLGLRRHSEAAKRLAGLDTGSVVRLASRPELMLSAEIALLRLGATTEAAARGAGRSADATDPNARRDAEATAARLQTHLSLRPEDALAWSHLSRLWAALDQPIRALRADAEAAAAAGDLAGAIDRAEGGRRRFKQPDAADFIELSVLDARLKVWRRQWREDLRDDGLR